MPLPLITSVISPFAGCAVVMREEFCRCSAPEFLELLRQLASHAQLPVGHDLGASRQRFHDPIGRLEKDRRLLAFRRCAQLAFALPAFDREKSAETKLIQRKSRSRPAPSESPSAGNDRERQIALDTFADQTRAGIGKSGMPASVISATFSPAASRSANSCERIASLCS